MGCDIHMVLEFYDEPNAVWVGMHGYDYTYRSALDDMRGPPAPGENQSSYLGWHARDRNYALFGELAGVRGTNNKHTIQPRGVPPDVSSLAQWRIDQEAGDGHSHSWVTIDEFIERFIRTSREFIAFVQARLEGGSAELREKIFQMVTGRDSGDFPDDAQIRIVFWFDN